MLVTGFPWYLGAATLVELGVFLLRRRGVLAWVWHGRQAADGLHE